MSTDSLLSAPSRFPRLQSAATPFLFILLGVIYASWAARIPAIRDVLQLSPAQLGIVLLGGGFGAVASFPLAAWLVGHFGGRRAAWYAGLGLIVVLPALALAPTMLWLVIAAIVLGAASGCFDVAINAIGIAHEKLAGRSTMSLLHAWFSVGAVSGALFGSLMAGFGITPIIHFSITALALLLPLYLAYQALPPEHVEKPTSKQYFAIAHGPLVALGIIGFCGAVAEGSIADWSGVFMKDQMDAHDGVAPLAYAGFAALMLLARLVCDRLKDSYGARRVVAAGASLAACGILPWLALASLPFFHLSSARPVVMVQQHWRQSPPSVTAAA